MAIHLPFISTMYESPVGRRWAVGFAVAHVGNNDLREHTPAAVSKVWGAPNINSTSRFRGKSEPAN